MWLLPNMMNADQVQTCTCILNYRECLIEFITRRNKTHLMHVVTFLSHYNVIWHNAPFILILISLLIGIHFWHTLWHYNRLHWTCHTVFSKKIWKTNSKIKYLESWKESTSIPLTHKYMTAHFPGLEQTLQ